MRLTEKQFEKMNAYVGCGPHSTADILIMGNEEGTDGYPDQIAAHAAARFRLYGKDEAAVEELLDAMDRNKDILYEDDVYPEERYRYAADPEGGWGQGFWEPNANSGRDKIESYMKRYFGFLPDRTKPNGGSLFNQYIARLCLAVQAAKNEPGRSFERYFVDDAEEKPAIEAFVGERLYMPDPQGGVTTALMDWRPLPRPNEGGWPEVYRSLFETEKEYMDAFDFKKKATNRMKAFVDSRMNYLKSVIVNSRAKHLITIGKVDNKIEILKRMFPEQKLHFRQIPISNRSYETRVALPDGRRLNVYALHFFEGFSKENLYYFASHHLVPDYVGYERPAARKMPEKPQGTGKPKKENRELQAKAENKVKRLDPGTQRDELRFLEELAERLKAMDPALSSIKPRHDKKVDYNYMFLWCDDRHWGKEACKIEVHVNFEPDTAVEISWRLREDRYEESLLPELRKASVRIGEELDRDGFKLNPKARKYIEYHRIVDGKRDERLLPDSAAVIQRVLSVARGIMAEI